MLILDRDGSVICADEQRPRPLPLQRGYAELEHRPNEDQTSRIGRLLALAFDQLGFHLPELRVFDKPDQH